MFEPLNLNHILADFYRTEGFTKYQWAVKPSVSSEKPSASDCSGWSRWTLLRAGIPNEFPDGSIAQGEWLIAQGLHQPNYSDLFVGDVVHDSGRLFLCGFNRGGTARHTFFIYCGSTMECAGSLHGVGSRWGQAFASQVQRSGWCVEIPLNLS